MNTHHIASLFGVGLWLAGAGHFCILFASFQVPTRLDWKNDLAKLHPLNRKLLWVYGGFTVFTIIAFGVIVYIARTARKLYSTGWAIALGLLLGGAAGNLGDRIFRAPGLFRGDVVDWIGVVPRYYPIFNLADSAIVCGGILTVLLAMLGYHLDGTHGARPPAAPDSPDEPGVSAEADAER